MRLPFQPPLEPMLAKLATDLPTGDGWLFEPKWDGFRAIVFRDGDETYIQSRDLKPLDRYFPELPPALKANLPDRCVVDGEIVIPGPDGLEFESLLLRIHPAASRVNMLAEQTPASFVALGSAGARRRGPARSAAVRAARDDRKGHGQVEAADPPDAGDARRGAGARLVHPVRGRRAGRRRCQATRRALPARQARHGQDQARADRGLCRRRLSVAQERARARTSDRCCWVCTTTRATCTT